MQNIVKKLAKPILGLLFVLSLCLIAPQEVKAAPSEIVLKDGNFEWQTTSSNTTPTGWKLYTKYWMLTIKNSATGEEEVVDIYQTENPETGYTCTDYSLGQAQGGGESTLHVYKLSYDYLNKESKWNLYEGDYDFEANAAIGFRYMKENKDGTIYESKNDGGTYKNQTDFWARCRHYKFKEPIEDRQAGYYFKRIEIQYLPVTINGDAGYETNGFYGSITYETQDKKIKTESFNVSKGGVVWVPRGGSITVYGTTKHGYKSNGSHTEENIKSSQYIYLTSTPWQHEVKYDPAGGLPGDIPGFIKHLNELAYVTNTIPSKPGYTFVEWKSNKTGKTYKPGDVYDHIQDGGTDTLVAQYKVNIYNFVFNGNGGEGYIAPIRKSYIQSFNLPQNKFTYGTNKYEGWDSNAGSKNAKYQPGDNINVQALVTELGLEYENNATIIIYALWDDIPRIEAEDRYFTLEQAQSGKITEDEIFRYASANDTEDGDIPRGEGFYLKNYEAHIYKEFIGDGSCSETFVAIDSAGNKVEKTIMVHIVDTTPRVVDKSENGYVRFISLKYLDCQPEDGGPLLNSIWREPDNHAYLKRVLSNHRINPEVRSISFLGMTYSKEVPGTGAWSDPEMIEEEWYLTQEDIKKVKEFISIHGMGNFKEPDALDTFREEFAHCIIFNKDRDGVYQNPEEE